MNKKIAMFIAFRYFQDEEYFIPKTIFENKGIEVKTISNQKGIAIGVSGGEAIVDFSLEEFNIDEFDCLVFVGGGGCIDAFDNNDTYEIIKESVKKNKLLGSICISPIILAKTGVLRGIRATVWSSLMDREPIKILKQYGAIYDPNPVVIDNNIITADGPMAAEEFAEKILDLLL